MDRGALFVTVVPPIAIGLIVYDTAGPPWDAMRVAGLGLLAFGLMMLSIARFQLGNSFSVTPQARKLVTRGIYSRIRHPVYVFGAITFLGLILYFRKPIFLVALALVIVAQILRARQEERVLEAAFGDEYRHYRQSTWF